MSFLSQNTALTYAQRAGAVLPQTLQKPIFTITGKVLITHILGEVTTVIQATANATKLCYRTEAGTSSDLCATNDITGDVLASYYTITGLPAAAMVNSTSSPAIKLSNPLTLNAGTIDLNCAGSATGAIKWTIHYTALEPGATIIPL